MLLMGYLVYVLVHPERF
ncbi:potassium-transporting ATPase subunit F [Hydrogenibacillus sp. N12]|nr:potassium-transporting ATPase subunit F [Hydrogenibacillus sp. N12]